MQTSVLNGDSVQPVNQLPEQVDLRFVESLIESLDAVARNETGPSIRDHIPEAVATELVERATAVVAAEGVMVDVKPSNAMCVNVHGDLHGHFFDLRHCLRSEGVLEGGKYCVFNGVAQHCPCDHHYSLWFQGGSLKAHQLTRACDCAGDFVDRGAWGVEVVLTLAALKLALPSQVYLLRGNHECEALARFYGFQKELEHKYPGQGRKKVSALMKKFAAFFGALPIAALIDNCTLVVHGGLWRRPSSMKRKGTRKKSSRRLKPSTGAPNGESLLPAGTCNMGSYKSANLQLGTLDDLRKATKGGLNPGYNQARHAVASDLLWSDPQVRCHGGLDAFRDLGFAMYVTTQHRLF